MPPNELAQAIAWLQDCGRLDTIIGEMFPKPDRWQEWANGAGLHPDDVPPWEKNGDYHPPVVPPGFEPAGPWKPWAAGDNWTAWLRPLRKLPAKEGAK